MKKKVKVKPGGAPLPHHVFCWWQCLTRDGICDATEITVSVSPVSAPKKISIDPNGTMDGDGCVRSYPPLQPHISDIYIYILVEFLLRLSSNTKV